MLLGPYASRRLTVSIGAAHGLSISLSYVTLVLVFPSFARFWLETRLLPLRRLVLSRCHHVSYPATPPDYPSLYPCTLTVYFAICALPAIRAPAIPHILLSHPYVITQCFTHSLGMFCHVFSSWSLIGCTRYALYCTLCHLVGSFAHLVSVPVDTSRIVRSQQSQSHVCSAYLASRIPVIDMSCPRSLHQFMSFPRKKTRSTV